VLYLLGWNIELTMIKFVPKSNITLCMLIIICWNVCGLSSKKLVYNLTKNVYYILWILICKSILYLFSYIIIYIYLGKFYKNQNQWANRFWKLGGRRISLPKVFQTTFDQWKIIVIFQWNYERYCFSFNHVRLQLIDGKNRLLITHIKEQ